MAWGLRRFGIVPKKRVVSLASLTCSAKHGYQGQGTPVLALTDMTGAVVLCICLFLCLSIHVFVFAVKSDFVAPSIGDEDSSSEGQQSQEEHCQAEHGGAVSKLPPAGGAHIHTSHPLTL